MYIESKTGMGAYAEMGAYPVYYSKHIRPFWLAAHVIQCRTMLVNAHNNYLLYTYDIIEVFLKEFFLSVLSLQTLKRISHTWCSEKTLYLSNFLRA